MSRLLRRWVAWTVTGEVAGFVAPAVAGVVTAASSAWVSIPALVVAGAVEGLVLGAAQAHALSPELPALDTRRFALLTSLAASLAYLVVMVSVAAAPRLQEGPLAAAILVVVLVGTVLLASIGTAQWLELRRHVARAWWWIGMTAVAWLAGLAVFMLIATPLWHEGQGVVTAVEVGLVAAVAMATTVALVTGSALQRMLRRRRTALT
ncbi:hypothetical protein LL946_17575 [Knoellia locipacati]|uniref:hypothetical protein n=1 Tax=Knoellia locipacati TaxID=882824 RepID=UPI00384F7E95